MKKLVEKNYVIEVVQEYDLTQNMVMQVQKFNDLPQIIIGYKSNNGKVFSFARFQATLPLCELVKVLPLAINTMSKMAKPATTTPKATKATKATKSNEMTFESIMTSIGFTKKEILDILKTQKGGKV